METMEDIARTALLLGQDPRRVIDPVAEGISEEDGGPLLRLMSAMPIQRVFSELRVQALRKRDFRFTRSDCLDFWSVALALAFSTDVVVDRKTFNLLQDGGVVEHTSARVVRTLSDLLDSLK